MDELEAKAGSQRPKGYSDLSYPARNMRAMETTCIRLARSGEGVCGRRAVKVPERLCRYHFGEYLAEQGITCVGPGSDGEELCRRNVYTRRSRLCVSHRNQKAAGEELRPIRHTNPPGVKTPCRFPDCGRPAKAHGLCSAHDAQSRSGDGTLKPCVVRRPERRSTFYRVDGLKECGMCLRLLPEEEFQDSKHFKDAKMWHCRRCAADFHLRRTFGITIDRYEEMLAEQGGVCARCKQPETNGKRLSVDHNRKCCPTYKSCGRCVRRLLCHRCNWIVGRAEESAELLRNLAAYIEEWDEKLGWVDGVNLKTASATELANHAQTGPQAVWLKVRGRQE
ncbi:endonuclease domain-containing protein [Arthrobacter mobilis]|uniref:Recombination endonuclease VII n=1 Tax=Arthrobacter mobilis TaxID=2724944 RepID=A0A7X6HFM5_9MICC|nr:endonuclease domain-containing protein [Arthrobacter mobilis]NKX56269.1 hypothetical protein [Arthrobacter mobilis]